MHNAIPPGGGFEEGTSLLCLHPATASGRIFERLALLMGRERSVYAPDIPGLGESDPPPSHLTIADYAGAIGDFLDSMRFRQIDLLGYREGATIAAELTIERATQIRRAVFVSPPVLDDTEREAFRRAATPVSPTEDGSHLTAEWHRVLGAYPPGIALEIRTRAFAERLRNGSHAGWMAAAALQYPAHERLPLVSVPALVVRLKDEFWEAASRARELLPKARFVDMPEHGNGVFEAAPDAVCDPIRGFLRA
ncbi:MAG TPA: alpha/beta hydrolase [Steroidobacteraceae bacterium]